MFKPILKWEPIIIQAAEHFRIDANLIRAIMMTESSGRADATRFEPHWHLYNRPSDFADHLGITREEEVRNQATSWSLMQTMGATVRDLGFTDKLEMLKVPEIGLFYGCLKLQKLFQRYGNENDVISSYNQGNNRKTPGGQYVNMTYCDKVHSYLNELRKLSV